jgi:transposase
MRYISLHIATRAKERAMSPVVKYVVRLTDEERQRLQQLIAGSHVARAKALRARILLKADADGPGWPDAQIAEALEVGLSTIHRLRQRCVEEGVAAALHRQPPVRTKPRKLDGAQEASLVAIACSPAPEGRAAWTLRLLADKLVELAVVESIGRETVRQTLKKMYSSPG